MSDVRILTGEEARRTVGEILENNPKPGDYVRRDVFYPVHFGAVGYFLDKSGDGKPLFSCFDNSTGDCWCEDFKTRYGAESWCRGSMSTDDVRKMEGNVEEIILSRDSFPALREKGSSEVADIPPHVKFDEEGEFTLDMQFYDGYAIDTNQYGLGVSDRIGLYYPTVREVVQDPYMQDKIEHTTGRRWAEGSEHEQIFDIAMHYGQAGRVRCPQERFDEAVSAIVERITDSGARSFSQEQRDTILLAVGSQGYHHDMALRESFFDMLFDAARPALKGCPKEWADDAREELKELSKGEIRDLGSSIRY